MKMAAIIGKPHPTKRGWEGERGTRPGRQAILNNLNFYPEGSEETLKYLNR